MRRGLATAAGVLALMLASAGSAAADYTSSVVNHTVTMTGDATAEVLTVSVSGGFLAQNRFAQADPGFHSALDWDTSVGGDQKLAVSDSALHVNINAGDGGDALQVLVGTPSPPVATFSFGGNGGNDGIILEGLGATGGQTFTEATDHVAETGGPTITYNSVDEPETIFVDGTDSGDRFDIDGVAPGATLVNGQFGDDVFDVEMSGIGSSAGISLVGGGDTDTLHVTDPRTDGHAYSVTTTEIDSDGVGGLQFDGFGPVSLATGGGPDRISKTGSTPLALDAGGGDDQLIARDSVADGITCGAGDDFVLSDPLDALGSDCEASDRTLAAGSGGGSSGGGGAGGSGGGSTPADTTAPKLVLSGVPKSIKLKKFLRGIAVKVTTDERTAVDALALGSARKVTLARAFDLTLAHRTLPLGGGSRTVKLKPAKRLVGKAKKLTVQISVTATDAAGNRTKATRTVKVKR